MKLKLPTAKWVYLNHQGKRGGCMLWNDKEEKYTSTKILAFCVQKRRGPYFLQCSRVHKAMQYASRRQGAPTLHGRWVPAAQRWKRVAEAQCETFSSSTRKWLNFKTAENSIQLKQCHSRTFSKVRQVAFSWHYTYTIFQFFWKPKKVEKEKKIFGNDDLHSKIPKLIYHAWGAEMGTHMCYNSPWWDAMFQIDLFLFWEKFIKF